MFLLLITGRPAAARFVAMARQIWALMRGAVVFVIAVAMGVGAVSGAAAGGVLSAVGGPHSRTQAPSSAPRATRSAASSWLHDRRSWQWEAVRRRDYPCAHEVPAGAVVLHHPDGSHEVRAGLRGQVLARYPRCSALDALQGNMSSVPRSQVQL